MSAMKLFLFGLPRVKFEGQPVELKRRKALALLAYLAISEHPRSRDALATLFYPEYPQSRARSYLRRDLAILNTSLGGEWLVADRDAAELKPGAWVDVDHFRKLLAVGQSHEHPQGVTCSDCLPPLIEAATLYTDDFMAGFTLRDSPEFDDWQFFQSESLRQEYALVLERLVTGLGAQKEYETAILHARRWVALDPLHEPAQYQLIRLYAQAGQQAAALRQYEEYVKLLEVELGIPPEEKTRTLYEAIKAQRILGPYLKEQGSLEATASPEAGEGRDIPAKLGRYELLEDIGQGGFATVYRARDTGLDRQVALKELDAKLVANTNWVNRFRLEAQVIARLDHPRIVTVHEFGEDGGRLFIVMRLVEGPSLADLLAEQRSVSWSEALEMIRAIGEGLDYAHGEGILHRDLKPANILIDPRRGPLLTDFGLAKLVGENSLSQSGDIVGTPHYIAPEVWEGQRAAAQTDIYALGCILYEMIIGEKLFTGKTHPSVMKAHFEPLKLPESWPEGVPGGVANVFRRVLSKQPGDRYQSAGELVAALTGLAEAEGEVAEIGQPDSLSLATQQREAGNYAAAIELLKPLLTENPADETVHRELMQLYALAGRRHEALRQYQACISALAEKGTGPDAELEVLYQQIVSGDVDPSSVSAPKPAWLPPVPIMAELERSLPLVGREEELELLQSKARIAWQGRGCTIILAGEAGVGKTRLAYELLRVVAMSRMNTLMGAAYEQECHLPYQPFIEAFDRYLTEHQRSSEQNPISHYQPLGSSDPQQEHTALFKASAGFLTALASRAPVVLLLDDLYAADEASLSLFHYLARQTQSASVILVATYRTDVVANAFSPFGRLINALYREQMSEVIHLNPLPEPAGAEIVSHTLDGAADPGLIKSIFEIAEGNPFFVQEITRAMLKADHLVQDQAGQWGMRPGASLQVPTGLQELLRERVRRLGPTVETVLSTAAAIGREFRFMLLRAVTDLPDGELLDALDAALMGRLLEETKEGYRFHHPLIRHTLYDTLSQARRAWLHTRTAEAIEADYAAQPEGLKPQVETLAFHYDLSVQRRRALPYLLQAGQKAADIFALEIASDYYERALALICELDIDDPAQRWYILEQLGSWASIVANTAQAVEYLEEALALSPGEDWQPDPMDRLRVHRMTARTLISAGHAIPAEQHLQAAMEVAADSGQATPDYAQLLYEVAMWYWHRNEYQESFEVGQRSLDIAKRLNDRIAMARAYEIMALACHSLGDWQQGLTYETQRATLVGPDLDVTAAFDVHL